MSMSMSLSLSGFADALGWDAPLPLGAMVESKSTGSRFLSGGDGSGSKVIR